MERLDKQFKILTRAIYERHGRAYGEVLANWDAIAGPRLAEQTAPERVLWPRQAPSNQKLGGTLIVRSDPAFALELQYETPLLIERINRYFGYGAIATIRIHPGAIARKPHPRHPLPTEPAADVAIEKQVAGITDDRLKAALSKLGLGLKSRKSS